MSKKLILFHLNGLYIGGSERYVQLLCKYLKRADTDKEFIYAVAAPVNSDMTRRNLFEEILGNKLILYGSKPEFIEIIKEIKPFILHRTSSGIAEWPFIPEIKNHTKHFVSLSVFGNQDDTVPISRVVYVSRWMQTIVQKYTTQNHLTINNPIEMPYTEDDMTEELGLKGKFVFGHIGRPDANTYDNLNLLAYRKIEDGNTCFVLFGVDELARKTLDDLKIRNYRLIPKTIDPIKISKFYNTIDMLAHSRKDGEVCPAVIQDAFYHGKSCISCYGKPYNGHVEIIGNCGYTVMPEDVDEYARLMKFQKLYLDDPFSYLQVSSKCKERAQQWNALSIAEKWLTMFKELT